MSHKPSDRILSFQIKRAIQAEDALHAAQKEIERPKSKPELTDAQILELWEQTYVQRGTSGIEFARAIEREVRAAPVQQEPEPIQVCRLMKKEEGIWVAASEFYAGHPDQKWVKLVSTNPGSWSIQRRVTGKQIADGLAKALAGTHQCPQEH